MTIYVPFLTWVANNQAKGLVSTYACNFATDEDYQINLQGSDQNDKPVYPAVCVVDNCTNPGPVNIFINGVENLIVANTRSAFPLPGGQGTVEIKSPVAQYATYLQFYQYASDAPPDLQNLSAIVNQAVQVAVSSIPIAQCQLNLTEGNAVLTRCNGIYLMVNGANVLVPNGGVALAPPAVAGTYYIFAYIAAGVMGLEADLIATGRAIDPNFGIAVKNGDASRTLVGMAYSTGAAWSLLRSWYNDMGTAITAGLANNVGTSSTTYTPLATATNFLAWANELFTGWVVGSNYAGQIGEIVATGFSLNGSTTPLDAQQIYSANNVVYYTSLGFNTPPFTVPEGLNNFTILGAVSENAADWLGGAAPVNANIGTRTTYGVKSNGINP